MVNSLEINSAFVLTRESSKTQAETITVGVMPSLKYRALI